MKRYILGLLVAGFGYLSVVSFSTGGGTSSMMGNRTGAGGTQNDCGNTGCHGPNASDLSIDFYLVDMYQDTVKNGRYTPGAIYTIKLYGRTTGVYPTFGFQLAAEKTIGFAGAGSYIPTSGLQANPVGAYEVIEQLMPLTSLNNNHFPVSIKWKAPGAGSGDIKFYVTMLGANNDGFANGDKGGNVVKTYQPNPTSVNDFEEGTEFRLFPNPAHEQMQLLISSNERGSYQLKLFNLNGQVVQARSVTSNTGTTEIKLNVSDLATGTYLLHIEKGGRQKVMTLLKN